MPTPATPSVPRRRFELRRGEHLSVVWVRPKAYRLCSYGEISDDQRRERWMIRRILCLTVTLCLGYPVAAGFWRAVMIVWPGPVATWASPVVDLLCLPLRLFCSLLFSPGLGIMRAYEAWCVGLLCEADHFALPAVTASLLVTLGFVLLIAYALSPVGYWLLARFCGFADLPLTLSQMEVAYAPLEWLVSRSRTLFEFYTHYFDLKEELD